MEDLFSDEPSDPPPPSSVYGALTMENSIPPELAMFFIAQPSHSTAPPPPPPPPPPSHYQEQQQQLYFGQQRQSQMHYSYQGSLQQQQQDPAFLQRGGQSSFDTPPVPLTRGAVQGRIRALSSLAGPSEELFLKQAVPSAMEICNNPGVNDHHFLGFPNSNSLSVTTSNNQNPAIQFNEDSVRSSSSMLISHGYELEQDELLSPLNGFNQITTSQHISACSPDSSASVLYDINSNASSPVLVPYIGGRQPQNFYQFPGANIQINSLNDPALGYSVLNNAENDMENGQQVTRSRHLTVSMGENNTFSSPTTEARPRSYSASMLRAKRMEVENGGAVRLKKSIDRFDLNNYQNFTPTGPLRRRGSSGVSSGSNCHRVIKEKRASRKSSAASINSLETMIHNMGLNSESGEQCYPNNNQNFSAMSAISPPIGGFNDETMENGASFTLNFSNQSMPNMKLPLPSSACSNRLKRNDSQEELNEVNLDDITVNSLKKLLKRRGRETRGKKTELIERVKEEIAKNQVTMDTGELSPTIISSGTLRAKTISPDQMFKKSIENGEFLAMSGRRSAMSDRSGDLETGVSHAKSNLLSPKRGSMVNLEESRLTGLRKGRFNRSVDNLTLYRNRIYENQGLENATFNPATAAPFDVYYQQGVSIKSINSAQAPSVSFHEQEPNHYWGGSSLSMGTSSAMGSVMSGGSSSGHVVMGCSTPSSLAPIKDEQEEALMMMLENAIANGQLKMLQTGT